MDQTISNELLSNIETMMQSSIQNNTAFLQKEMKKMNLFLKKIHEIQDYLDIDMENKNEKTRLKNVYTHICNTDPESEFYPNSKYNQKNLIQLFRDIINLFPREKQNIDQDDISIMFTWLTFILMELQFNDPSIKQQIHPFLGYLAQAASNFPSSEGNLLFYTIQSVQAC